jgi:D-alanyl-D-alanine carboxypeptidase
LFTGQLLPPAQQRELETTVPIAGSTRAYGLGVFSDQLCGRVSWGHNGDFPGYAGLSLTSPDGARQLTFAINDDAIDNPQFRSAGAELLGSALCT